MNNETKNLVIEYLDKMDNKKEITCKDAIKKKIGNQFEVSFDDVTDKKFNEAISGSGNELLKMDSIISSSLLAFLFFYSVSKSNPLFVDGVEYIESYFEYKNKVYSSPSNIDVVLKNDNNDLLFIECKFTEYLEKKSVTLSKKYLDSYYFKCLIKEKYFGFSDNFENVLKNEGHYKWAFKDHYTEGIKQIIAHLIGINNFKNNIFYNYVKGIMPNRHNQIREGNKNTVKLIEVVYKFDKKELIDYYKNYESDINKIKEIVNKGDNVAFLGLTTYQQILDDPKNKLFKERLNHKVKDFYNFNR